MLCASLGRADIESDLIAYYNFEGLTGTTGETVVDQTGHGHNGVCRQDQSTLKAPAIVSGPTGLGDALSYDGAFYVQIPNHTDFDIVGPITMAAWIKVDLFDLDWQTFFCRGDWSWRLHRSDGGSSDPEEVAFHMSGLSDYGPYGVTDVVDGQWHHIVGVWPGDGTPATLYVDGGIDAVSGTLTGTINTEGNDPVTIGAQINNGNLGRQWKGQIDEVRLYDRALNSTEVADLYAFTLAGANSTPSVTLPASKTLKMPDNVEFKLNGTVADDGNPLPDHPASPDPADPNKLSWWWEIVTKPVGADDPIFLPDDPYDLSGSAFVYDTPYQPIAVDPNVKFSQYGLYELRLHATDGQKSNQATISVLVNPPGISEQGYMYLSPVPGAEYVSAQTRYVLVRFEDVTPYDITNLSSFITVVGDSSGSHSGTTKIASDNRTVIYTMSSDFSNGETATVTLMPNVDPGAGGTVDPYQYQFYVTGPAPSAAPQQANRESTTAWNSSQKPLATTQDDNPTWTTTLADGPMIMPNGVSVPSNFPFINITTNDNPDPSYIFLDNRTSGSNSYNVIFDTQGNPIWYLQTNDERRDMKVQQNGVLTMLARDGYQRYIGLDENYNEIAEYRAVNGYSTDEHELVVLPDGHYLLIGLRSNTVDMTQYLSGASTSASVGETVIQEFTPEGDLIFQWRAWDNFDVRDVHLDNPYGSSFRFPHMNAIDIDEDGNILLSSRHLSEITKINRDNGDIIWRLSGIVKNNDFTFVNDNFNPPGPRNQHAIRHTGANRYLMFDNGNLHSPSASRALEYELDLDAMTATVVFQYPATQTSSLYAHYMGNTQRLSNGNTLINWAIGSLPKLTEVRPDGTKAFEMNWVDGFEAYRVWKHDWHGRALKPTLVEVYNQPDNVTLIFNQFGDPEVAYYNIYADTSPNPTTLLDTSNVTMKRVTGLADGERYYFRVTSVSNLGVESDFSNELYADVRVIPPGQNIVVNGDFAQGISDWSFDLNGSASASFSVINEEAYIDITTGGTLLSDVQLFQTGMPLIQSEKYILEFDARCAAPPRLIEVKVGQDNADYSKIGPIQITPNSTHYRYTFTMTDPSDYDAQLMCNLGTYTNDVYLDNISLIKIVPGDFNNDGCVRIFDLYILAGEWLHEQSGLLADMDDSGKVDMKDFTAFAVNWMNHCAEPSEPPILLVPEGATKKVLVPTDPPYTPWTGGQEPFDDSGWDLVNLVAPPYGIGYENSPGDAVNYTDLIGHDVQAEMSGIMTSCYIRIPFTLNTDPSELNYITLNIRYDDGFVAYINGEELTRDNIDAVVPDWDDEADGLHDDTLARQLISFIVNRAENPDVFDALQLGDNILAIHGLNDNLGSSDFLISAELLAGQ